MKNPRCGWNTIPVAAIPVSTALAGYGRVTIYDGSWSSTRSSSSYNNVLLHASRELDSESGIVRYRTGYYGCELGRFVSREPARNEARDRNPHRNVGNVSTYTPFRIGNDSYGSVTCRLRSKKDGGGLDYWINPNVHPCQKPGGRIPPPALDLRRSWKGITEKTPSGRAATQPEGYTANLSIRCLPAVWTPKWFS